VIHLDKDKQVIENYQNDEEMMILLYAQWCINHDLDPVELYVKAYPNQPKNDVLLKMLESTVAKEQSEMIPDQMIISVLQTFGNDDLAFVVHEEKEKLKK